MGGDKGKGKSGAGRKGNSNIFDLPFCFKVLCPEELVGSLMGNGGKIKEQIQDETGARLLVSQRDEYYPQSHYRILSVFHDAHEGILDALMRIIDKIMECGDKEREAAGRIEFDFLGKQRGEYVLRSAVSTKMSGAIIGPKGTRVAEIRKRSNARISIDTSVHEGHQMLSVVANPDGLRAAVEMINPSIQEESGSEWFRNWATFVFPAIDDRRDTRDTRDTRRPPERERERSPRRGGGRERYQEARSEPHRGGNGRTTVDQDLMQMLADAVLGLPMGSLDTEFALSCDLPREKVSSLIGPKGDNVKDVRRQTRTRVHFEEAQANESQQRMELQGSLVDLYRAHALMMKRYHESELPPAQKGPDVQAIQQQLEDLQRQLADAKQASSRGKR